MIDPGTPTGPGSLQPLGLLFSLADQGMDRRDSRPKTSRDRFAPLCYFGGKAIRLQRRPPAPRRTQNQARLGAARYAMPLGGDW
jgi:hypothetical protein